MYRIVENPFEKDAAIEITEGEYKGLVFQFGKVQFKEGEPHINFQRTIRRLPDIVEVKSDEEIDKLLNNKELEQVMGDILVEIMQDQIEREKNEQRNSEGNTFLWTMEHNIFHKRNECF